MGLYSWFYMVVTIALIAVGAIVTLFPPENINVKAFYLLMFIVLGIGSGAIYLLQRQEDDKKEHARNAEQTQMRTQLAAQGDQLTQLLAMSSLPKSSPEETENLRRVLAKLERAISAKKPEQIPLKTKAAHLSAEIFKFLEDNPWPLQTVHFDDETDPEKRRAKFATETQQSIDHFHRLMRTFETKFSVRIAAIRNELAAAGYQDAELDRSYQFPVNMFSIRNIAQIVGVMAENMPTPPQ